MGVYEKETETERQRERETRTKRDISIWVASITTSELITFCFPLLRFQAIE